MLASTTGTAVTDIEYLTDCQSPLLPPLPKDSAFSYKQIKVACPPHGTALNYGFW